MHAAEAIHGDLGIYNPWDPTILISKSGNTEELVRLIPILKEFQSPLIAIVGNMDSFIAKIPISFSMGQLKRRQIRRSRSNY